MAIRRGEAYLAGLQDEREIWLEGKRVNDVVTHPDFAACAQSLAEVYDLQHDPAAQDVLTMVLPDGERVSRGFVEPRSVADLVARREMIEFLMRRSGGTTGRLPEYMAAIMVGLHDVRNILGAEDPSFADHVAEYFDYIRGNDLALTHSFADAPRDSRLSRDKFENLRVVEERADGIVIRGVKSVATLAPYADEYLALAPMRPGLAADEIVYFAVPMATRGLRVYCRQPLARSNRADHPLGARFDEMDAWVVFDNVFVPRKRVFYLHRTEGHRDLLNQILSWAFYHILIRMACKAEVLAGIGAAITDYLGKEQLPTTQLMLCDLYGYAETLKAFIIAAEQNPVESPTGLVIPNPTQITLGRIFGVEPASRHAADHPRAVRLRHPDGPRQRRAGQPRHQLGRPALPDGSRRPRSGAVPAAEAGLGLRLRVVRLTSAPVRDAQRRRPAGDQAAPGRDVRRRPARAPGQGAGRHQPARLGEARATRRGRT